MRTINAIVLAFILGGALLSLAGAYRIMFSLQDPGAPIESYSYRGLLFGDDLNRLTRNAN